MKEVDRIGEGIFELEHEIGAGGAATVWKAKELEEPHRSVAVKLVTYPAEEYDKRNETINEFFAREARTWADFQRSPYVVQLYHAFRQCVRASGGLQYIFGFVMEFSAEGDLRRAITEGRFNLDKPALISFLLDVARGLKEGHDRDTVHRDIKASNVLLFKGVPNKVSPKLMDFGLSITTERIDSRLVGTPEYMAPEVFDHPETTAKSSDIYSLAILFFEIICLRLPFHFSVRTKEERLKKYRDAHQNWAFPVDELAKHCDKSMVKLLALMAAKNPSNRPGLSKIIAYLEKLQVSEMVESLRATPLESRKKEGRYIWHPSIHASISEMLSYFVISGTSFRGDPTWLTNNLKDKGFHGFSIYRIMGGYDYILRIWCPEDAQDDLDKIMRDFRDFHNGSYLRFNTRDVILLRGKRVPKPPTVKDVIRNISQCLTMNEDAELRNLREKGFIIGTMTGRESRSNRLRFFLTVNVGARTEPFLVSAYASEFRNRLLSSKLASSVSIYVGDGDFQILVKFRLRKFEQFSLVYDTFLTTKALVQRNDSLITSQTFVEFGAPQMESDDGMILAEIGSLTSSVD